MAQTDIDALPPQHMRSVLTYGLTNALPRLSSVALAIFYASVFSAAEYGTYGILTVTVLLISTLLDLGMSSAVMRDFYDHQGDWHKAKRFMADLVASADMVAIIILPLLGIALYFGWTLVGEQAHHVGLYILLLLAAGMVDRASLTLGHLLRASDRSSNYAVGPICEAISLLACGVLFVTVLNWGVPGAVAALLAGRSVSLLAYRLVFRFSLDIGNGTPSWRLIKRCLGFGLPIVPVRLATWAREAGLRPFLTSVVSMNAIGSFSFASSLSSLPTLIAVAVDLALFPHYLKQRSLGIEGFARRVTDFSEALLAGLLPIWAILILFSRELVNAVAADHFEQAGPICAILLCASFIRMQQPFFVRQIYFIRHTWIQPAAMMPSALISIALSLFLAHQYGIEQAAWGVLVAEAVCFFGLVLFIRIYEPVHYPVSAATFIGLALAVLAAAVSFESLLPWDHWQKATLKIVLLLAVTVTSWTLWVWPHRELMRSLARS